LINGLGACVSEITNVTPLEVSEWDPKLAGVADDMRGRPLNVHKLMAKHPDLLLAWWDLRNHAVRGGTLDQRHREMVILRVAVHMKSWYEWASHVERGLKAGLSIEEIERIRQEEFQSDWTRDDQLVLRATNECLMARRISKKTLVDMRNSFDATQIMDLIAIVGVYVILGTMINTWGLELDDFIDLPGAVQKETWLGS
jgi:alkylhydroperoxidase/carboxymuconolactone decarboxylase family protein YurZ